MKFFRKLRRNEEGCHEQPWHEPQHDVHQGFDLYDWHYRLILLRGGGHGFSALDTFVYQLKLSASDNELNLLPCADTFI